MDVSDASYYIYIEKKKNKGSQMGHTKKIFFEKKKKKMIYRGMTQFRFELFISSAKLWIADYLLKYFLFS
jgi:hypothetical protein